MLLCKSPTKVLDILHVWTQLHSSTAPQIKYILIVPIKTFLQLLWLILQVATISYCKGFYKDKLTIADGTVWNFPLS